MDCCFEILSVALCVNFCHPQSVVGSVTNYVDDRGSAMNSKLIGSFGWRQNHEKRGVDRRQEDKLKAPSHVKSPKLLTFANLLGGPEGDPSDRSGARN